MNKIFIYKRPLKLFDNQHFGTKDNKNLSLLLVNLSILYFGSILCFSRCCLIISNNSLFSFTDSSLLGSSSESSFKLSRSSFKSTPSSEPDSSLSSARSSSRSISSSSEASTSSSSATLPCEVDFLGSLINSSSSFRSFFFSSFSFLLLFLCLTVESKRINLIFYDICVVWLYVKGAFGFSSVFVFFENL